MNLIMHKLNQVRLPVHSREFVSPYLSPGMYPGIDLFTEIPSLERFTKNLEKGLECASLNNPVSRRNDPSSKSDEVETGGLGISMLIDGGDPVGRSVVIHDR
jgi:hypothetical protein